VPAAAAGCRVALYSRGPGDHKDAADEYLLALPLHGVVVRPSLVFGAQGESASRMLTMAAMPLLALPEGGGSWSSRFMWTMSSKPSAACASRAVALE
jgi:hypothetical protein